MASRIFIGLLIGASSIGLAVPALAQSSDSEGAADARTPGADIIVTGSRIVRDGYTAPTPVTVATTEDLAKTTPSSIPDALNKLPQFGNSLSPGKASTNWSTIPIHGNILNLRSLGTPSNNPKGPLRTLILFDGIRVPATTYVGTVDTNVLPQLLMERVDVVTGGASAGYGSDAVAGVVNFVLNKKYTGIKGVAQAGITSRGDNGNQRLGVAGGFSFAEDRGHILLSAEYYNNEGMLRNERKGGASNYVLVGSNIGAGGPGTAANPYKIASGVVISALSPNGRIMSSSVAGNPYVGQYINTDGTTRPFNLGTPTGTTGFQIGGDGYDIPADNYSIIPFKTYQGFGRIAYDVTDDINAYVQGTWSRTDMHYTTMQNALIPPTEAITVYKGNPFLSAALDASLTGPNDFIVVGQASAGQDKPVANERTDFWMATAGLDGGFGGFKWGLSYTHGESKHDVATSGLYENWKLFAAVDVVTNPANGQPICRVLLDPAYASRFAGCKPMDVLHGNPQASTPEGYAYATGTARYKALLKQDSVQANLSGSLFDLPAGPVDFAVGAEYRKTSLSLVSNSDPAALDRATHFAGLRSVPSGTLYYWLNNVGTADGSINVKEAYAELAIPLLKDTPFFQELSLNGAARITDYSTSGTVKTWKAGATWRPIVDLLFRGAYSRDIRAPNAFELFAGAQSGIGIVNDLQIKDSAGNPIYGSGLNVNVNSVISGNLNLKPETGKTLTLGGVYSPSFLPGFSLAIDYYSIKVTKIIETLTAQQILTNCYNAGGTGAVECGLIDRATPTSFPTLVHIVPANIAFLKTSGLDFDAGYRTELGNGALGLRLYASRLLKFDAQQYDGAPIAHYRGVSVTSTNPAGFPTWRGTLSADYTNGPFGITLSEQYIGKMRNDIPGGPRPIVYENPNVPSVWYTDLSVRFTIPHGDGNFELFGNVNNLFDKDPPLIPSTVPGANPPTNIAVYDTIGRAFTAGVRFKF